MRRLDAWVIGSVVAIGAAVSGAVYQRLEVFPLAVALLLPFTAIVTYVALRVVSRRSAPAHLHEPIAIVAAHVVVFIVTLHVLVVCNLAGVGWARVLGPRAVVVLLGAAVIAAGNMLPRVRPNLALGIRTRRTLADPRLWARVHRVSGYAAVALGCVTAGAGLFLSGPAIGVVVSVTAMLAITSVGIAYRSFAHD